MRKNTFKIVAAAILILSGIALQFVSTGMEKNAETYQPVTAVIDEYTGVVSVRMTVYTRMKVSYTVDGQDYHLEIEEPYVIHDATEWTLFYPEGRPAEAVTHTDWEQLSKKATVPRLVGWGLMGAAILLIVLSVSKMLPVGHRSNTDEQRPNPLYTGLIEVYRSEPGYDTKTH